MVIASASDYYHLLRIECAVTGTDTQEDACIMERHSCTTIKTSRVLVGRSVLKQERYGGAMRCVASGLEKKRPQLLFERAVATLHCNL